MNSGEGLRRFARVIEIIGWLWGVALVGIGLMALHGANFDSGLMCVVAWVLAALGLGLAKGLGWIIRGFAAQ